MGGSSSTIPEGELYDSQDFTEVEQSHDSRYGAITKLLDNRTQQLVCVLKQRNINTQADFDGKVQHLRGRRELNHYSLVKFINYTAEKTEEFCSTHWTISQLYEYVSKDLKEQIQVRRASNLRYTEGELWYLLQTTVEGLTYLKVQDIIHGDIRPSQILLTDAGKVKLGEQFQHQQSLSGYQQLLMDQRKEEYFLSPQVFETLQDRHTAVQFDVASNDVFSLGLTILEAAVLRDSDDYYNTETYTFICERLRESLAELQNLYSPKFYDMVSRMLIESDCDRPSMEDIHKELDTLVADDLFRRDIAQEITLYEIQAQEEEQQVVYTEQEQVGEQVIEEHVSHASHHVQQQQQPLQAYQQTTTTTVQQQATVSGYDLKDIDDRINLVLAKSRETVQQYGGQKAFEAYQNYENSKGYEPVRRSQLDDQAYTSQIYKPDQNYMSQVVDQEKKQVYTTTTTYNTYQKPAESVQQTVTNTVNQTTQEVAQSQNTYQPQLTQTQNTYKPPVTTTQTTSYQPQQASVTTTYQAPISQTYVPPTNTSQYQAPQVNQTYNNTGNYVSSSYQPAPQSTTTTYQPATTMTQNYQVPSYSQTTTTTYQQQQQPPVTGEELDQQIQRSLARNQQVQETIRSTQQQIENVQ